MKNIKLFLFLGLIANFVFADDIYRPNVEHFENEVDFEGSIVQGQNAFSTNESTFVFNGDKTTNYSSHGDGTFNINPAGGVDGLYIGDKPFVSYIPIQVQSDWNEDDITKPAYITNKPSIITSNIVSEIAQYIVNEMAANGWEVNGTNYQLVVHIIPLPPAETTFTFDTGIKEIVDISGTLDLDWMKTKGYYNNGWSKIITQTEIGTNVTRIGNSTFASCTSLTNVTIVGGVTSIENWAFSECSGLKDITIGDSVTDIGGYAFYGCSGLTSVAIPDSVTSIGDYAFYYCPGLMSVDMSSKTVTDVQDMNYRSWKLPSGCIITCSGGETITIP